MNLYIFMILILSMQALNNPSVVFQTPSQIDGVQGNVEINLTQEEHLSIYTHSIVLTIRFPYSDNS